MPNQTEVILEWRKKRFLIFYRKGGTVNISATCLTLGVKPRKVRLWMEQDEKFKADFEGVRDEILDTLETEAIRRSRDGVRETIYFRGTPCGTKMVYSDTLLSFLLKSYRPEVFGDRVELNNLNPGINQTNNILIGPDKLSEALAILRQNNLIRLDEHTEGEKPLGLVSGVKSGGS